MPRRKLASGLMCLPPELFGAVCGMLGPLEALAFLTLVVRRPEVRVPWTAISNRHAFWDNLVPDYKAVVHLGCLSHLTKFEAVLSADSVAFVADILALAPNLRSISLLVTGATGLLDAIQCPAGTTDLEVSLRQAELSDNTGLSRLLGSLPALTTLQLEFFPVYAHAPADWLAGALRALKPGCLHTLRLSGDTESQIGLTSMITDTQPRLTALGLDLTDLEDVEHLARLQLERCWLRSDSLSGLKVVERMAKLKSVHLEIRFQSGLDGMLRLPDTVREFVCDSWSLQVEASELETLKVAARTLLQINLNALASLTRLSVSHMDLDCAASVRALLPQLTSLQVLVLSCAGDRPTQLQVMTEAGVCPCVRYLALDRLTYINWHVWEWIATQFPNLVELEFREQARECRQTADRKPREAFRVLPNLRKFTDRGSSKVAIVTKSDTGQLVRRQGSTTKILY